MLRMDSWSCRVVCRDAYPVNEVYVHVYFTRPATTLSFEPSWWKAWNVGMGIASHINGYPSLDPLR